ncbi:MAG TPA: CHASE3 domain-containing protein, partial [Segetibacter sp.]
MKKGLPLIIIGYSLSFIILIIAFLFSRRLYNLVDYSDKIEHTYRVRNQMLKVQSKLIEAESSQRAFILINDSIYFRPIKHFQLEILAEVDSLKRLFDTVQVQQEALITLKKTISSRFQLLYQTIEDADANDKLKFIADAKKGKELMNEFSILTARM